jgi:hypothetical protein
MSSTAPSIDNNAHRNYATVKEFRAIAKVCTNNVNNREMKSGTVELIIHDLRKAKNYKVSTMDLRLLIVHPFCSSKL